MRHLRLLLLCLLVLAGPALGACGETGETGGNGGGAATGYGDPTGEGEPTGEGDPHSADRYAVYETLEVEPGGEDVVREGGVARAEKRDAYVVEPSEFGTGQQLNVAVSSVEDNASVRVYGPDGSVLAAGVDEASIDLTEGGAYVIEVGPTRGNATYTLRVNVSVNAD